MFSAVIELRSKDRRSVRTVQCGHHKAPNRSKNQEQQHDEPICYPGTSRRDAVNAAKSTPTDAKPNKRSGEGDYQGNHQTDRCCRRLSNKRCYLVLINSLVQAAHAGSKGKVVVHYESHANEIKDQ